MAQENPYEMVLVAVAKGSDRKRKFLTIFLMFASLLATGVNSMAEPSFFDKARTVGKPPSSQELVESFDYLEAIATEKPDELTWGIIIFQHALSSSDMASWIEDCDCEVVMVSLSMYYGTENSFGNSGSEILDFGLTHGSARERLTHYEAKHVRSHARSNASMVEFVRQERLKFPGVATQYPQKLVVRREIGTTVDESNPSRELVEQILKSQGLDNPWFVYREAQVIAKYSELWRLQFNPKVAWARPESERVALAMLDTWSRVVELQRDKDSDTYNP